MKSVGKIGPTVARRPGRCLLNAYFSVDLRDFFALITLSITMDKLLITLILLCCLTVSGMCQSAMEKGDRYFNKKDYANALDAYLSLGSTDDPDLNYKIGYSYLFTE